MAETFTFTKLVYEEESEDTSESNTTIEYNIPTIQNMTVSQNETLPTKNTLSGDFRQQFVIRKPPTVTFTMILQDDTFLGQAFTIDEFIELFEKLRTERIRFDIVTNRSKLNEQYLTDLAIKNISYKRDNKTRQIVTVDITCIQVRFAAITWELVNLVELFGTTFTTETTNPNNKIAEFVIRSDTEEKFKSKSLFEFYKPDSVNELIGKAIKNKLGSLPGFHWELPTPIDFRQADQTWDLTARLGSTLNTEETNGAAYGINLLDITFETHMFEEVEWTKGMLLASQRAPVGYREDSSVWIYDFTNTYRHAVPESTFEKRIKENDIWNWLTSNREYWKAWDKDIDVSYSGTARDIRITQGDIGRIWVKRLRDTYWWSLQWRGTDTGKSITSKPNDISFEWLELTTSKDSYSPNFGKYKDVWDNITGKEYTVYILLVTVGSLAQIFLFAPNLTSDPTLITNAPKVTSTAI